MGEGVVLKESRFRFPMRLLFKGERLKTYLPELRARLRLVETKRTLRRRGMFYYDCGCVSVS